MKFRKTFSILILIFICLLATHSFVQRIEAYGPNSCNDEEDYEVDRSIGDDDVVYVGSNPNAVVNGRNFPDGTYEVVEYHEKGWLQEDDEMNTGTVTVRNGEFTFNVPNDWFVHNLGDDDDKTWDMYVTIKQLDCSLLKYRLRTGTALKNLHCEAIITSYDASGTSGYGCYSPTTNMKVVVDMRDANGNPYNGGTFYLKVDDKFGTQFNTGPTPQGIAEIPLVSDGRISGTGISADVYTSKPLRVTIHAERHEGALGTVSEQEDICDSQSVLFSDSCSDEDILQLGTPPGGEPDMVNFDICTQVPAIFLEPCQTCGLSQGVWTAIGCINTEPVSVVKTIVYIGLYMSGGFILLIIVVAAFLITTSRGDPKQVTQAKELITSAVTGVIVIIFSVTILRFIGVDILKIPGFGS